MTPHFDPYPTLPLWDGEPPLRRPEDAALSEDYEGGESRLIKHLTNVSTPTLSFFPATAQHPTPCVLVCPGGGYRFLAWNHEGTDVVHGLLASGISAAILKYRCPDRRDQALCDARRAIRMLRARAGEWNILPGKIGILGFSAGGSLAIRTCCSTEPDYPHRDRADELSCRPDFAVPIYPAYIKADGPDWNPVPDLDPAKAPPTFMAQSQDDPYWESAYAWAIALRKAGVPFEHHVWPEGGHGWGMRKDFGNPSAAWFDLAVAWIRRVTESGSSSNRKPEVDPE